MKRVSVAVTDEQIQAVDRLIQERNRESWLLGGGRWSRDRVIGSLFAAELRRLEKLNQPLEQK
ncbi:hypothetical protein [Variovorax durovernensis]